MACASDACRQGRDPCPTPQACELPEADLAAPTVAIVRAAVIAVCLLALLAALFS